MFVLSIEKIFLTTPVSKISTFFPKISEFKVKSKLTTWCWAFELFLFFKFQPRGYIKIKTVCVLTKFICRNRVVSRVRPHKKGPISRFLEKEKEPKYTVRSYKSLILGIFALRIDTTLSLHCMRWFFRSDREILKAANFHLLSILSVHPPIVIGKVSGLGGNIITEDHSGMEDRLSYLTVVFWSFLAIFRNEITTILTPSTSEGSKWKRWDWTRFSFWRSLITNPQC